MNLPRHIYPTPSTHIRPPILICTPELLPTGDK